MVTPRRSSGAANGTTAARISGGLIIVGLLLSYLSGCAAPRHATPLAAELARNDEDSQVAYWMALVEQPVVSNDQAFHGLLLFADQKDDSTDFASRVATMKSRGMLPAYFDEPPDAPARRGTLAVAIAKILDIRGGLLMRLTNAAPRYALRELVYRGIYPPSSENQTFSGVEFTGVIGKVEDVQRIAIARRQGGGR